ncbi:MAG: diguanylate cyclase domain-containing protein [Saccharospirillum sp.]
MISDPVHAADILHQAAVLSEARTDLGQCQLQFHWGWCAIFSGDHLGALKALARGLTLAERLSNDAEIMRICNGIGMAYHNLGQYGEAMHHYERSLRLNRLANDTNGTFAAILNLAALYFDVEDVEKAEELVNEAIGFDTAQVTAENLGEAALLQAKLHSRQSRFKDAMLGCRAALGYANELNYAHLEIQALIAVARCQRLQHRFVEAETTLEVIIDHPEFCKEGVSGLHAYIELAKIQAASGRFSLAVRSLRKGLRQDNLPEFSLIQQRALETLATCLERAKKYRAATLVLRLALDIERKLQNQDVHQQIELRRFRAEMDTERLNREITDHQNRLLKEARSRLQLINELARQLASSLDLNEIGQKLYAIVRDRLDVHFMSLAINRERARAVEFVVIFDDGQREPNYCISYDVKDSQVVRAILGRETILLDNTVDEPGRVLVGSSALQPVSQLYLPLVHNQQVIGMVSLQSAKAKRFNHDEMEWLSSLAPFLAITLSNALSHQRLFELNSALTHEKSQIEAAQERIEHMAHHDTLTGLPNRRLLTEFVDQKVHQSLSHSCCFHLVYIDLDGFKPVNDRYGHKVGDEVLTILAQRLRESLRKTDFAARVGGDEFIIVIEDFSDPANLDAFIQRILAVIKRPIGLRKDQIAVSASIGVARFGPHGKDLDTLMHNADLAMYEIKRAGKGGIAYAGKGVVTIG